MYGTVKLIEPIKDYLILYAVHLNLPLELTKQGIERETAQNKENKTAFKSHTGVSFICPCMIALG